jgi:hypothetical protein
MSEDLFYTALSNYLERLQAAQVEDFKQKNYKQPAPQYGADTGGSKYIRIVRSYGEDQRSVHCFVEKSTGKIWKAAGWRTPAKNFPRGSIFELPINNSALLRLGT